LFLNLSNNHRQSLLPKEEIVSIAKIKTVRCHFVRIFVKNSLRMYKLFFANPKKRMVLSNKKRIIYKTRFSLKNN